VEEIAWQTVDVLPGSERAGGFGHTGS
jgi:dUTPase